MADDETLHVLLVDGSPQPSSGELVAGLARECDLVIAVDRGAETCRAAGVVPDAFCGDCDTCAGDVLAWVREQGVREEDFDVEKDSTDLALAFELAGRMAAERGAESWMPVVTCASGGRTDHLLGVMGVLAANAATGPMLVEDGYEALVLSPGGRERWELGEMGRGKDFSLVALRDSVVSEENMYWELDHEPLSALADRGISNKVTTGFASVSCHEGCALAMLFWGE